MKASRLIVIKIHHLEVNANSVSLLDMTMSVYLLEMMIFTLLVLLSYSFFVKPSHGTHAPEEHMNDWVFLSAM